MIPQSRGGGEPDVGSLWEIECRWQDSGDFVGLFVNRDGLAERGGPATKGSRGEGEADDGRAIGVAFGQQAAVRRASPRIHVIDPDL